MGRIPDDSYRRNEKNNVEFHVERVKATWYASVDASQIKTPKGGKSAAEVAAIQEIARKHAASNPSEDDRREKLLDFGLAGMTDEILDALRDKLANMTATEVRIAKDAAAVLKAEIEIAQMRNELVRKADVYAEFFEFGQRIRQRLEGVAVRVVDNVISADTRIEAIKAINDEIDACLSELTAVPSLRNE